VSTFLDKSHPYNTHPHVFRGKPKTNHFVIFEVFPAGVYGGQLKDGTAVSHPQAICVSDIERAIPHAFVPAVTELILRGDRHDPYVRGTLEEVVAKLNEAAYEHPLFVLTPREQQLHEMREDGYSLSQRALACDMTPFAVAKADSKIEKKLEASNAGH
jgi:DNA-binding CsgD family transcriptional regulator